MKINIYTKKIFLSGVILGFVFLPLHNLMADNWIAGPLVPCATSKNPEPCTLCHLVVGFYNIFKWGLALLFTACILFVTVAGVIYMVSSGNKAMMDWAKKALLYSLTAFILFLCSWLIVTAVMIALGYKQVNNWWTFTCDETSLSSSTGATPSSPTTTPGPAQPPGTPGTCQGISTQTNIDQQCKDVSPALSGLLACMKDKLPSGAQISSISDSAGYNNCKTNYSSLCAHTQGSCHYGGTCTDGSHAADISTRNASGTDIMNAANGCGATYILNEGNHIHISVGQGCNCK